MIYYIRLITTLTTLNLKVNNISQRLRNQICLAMLGTFLLDAHNPYPLILISILSQFPLEDECLISFIKLYLLSTPYQSSLQPLTWYDCHA